jgi:NRAMP (natural resistance-associated macrophage protein)-like metal ion transporter
MTSRDPAIEARAGDLDRPDDAGRAGRPRKRWLRALGLGLITGAADDDPSAIGTYASAGARLGPAFLWIAPVMFPMMFAVVYLSSKLGLVSGKGLFAVIRDHYSRWILYPTLIGVLAGNVIEAAADLGGMAAALQLLVPVPLGLIVVVVAAIVLALQVFGSYTLIRNVFRWLALSLLAYAAAAVLAKPDLREVLRGTFVPTLRFDREFLSLVVAVIGTTLSAYLYTWQSNEEVEEKISHGKRRDSERRGATRSELRQSRIDVLIGMLFSNAVMYFVLLGAGATLFKAGKHDVETAAQAAGALAPLAGEAAGLLFAVGVVAVGFLAVPVMTTGAAYDFCQSVGWRSTGLSDKPREGKRFYLAIAAFTALAVALNFLGVNPMKALVWSGIVQGFSTPPLMFLLLLMTGQRRVMGEHVNGRGMKILGGVTVLVTTAATAGLVVTWIV